MSTTSATPRAEPTIPAPLLRVNDGELVGTVFRLEADTGTLGRREDNLYVLAHPRVSRVHARITREVGSVIVTDLGSSGGTRVNGELITGSAVLRHGDSVSFGSVTATFEDPAQLAAREEDTQVLEARPAAAGTTELSPRQEQVVQLMGEGMTNREIGEQLGIAGRTVKAYAEEIYDRLDTSNRAGAVAQAARLGLL